MDGSTIDPISPSKPATLLASLCSVLLLLRRRHTLPSSTTSSSPSLVTILDRSLGATVTLGLSLAILKWVAANHSNSIDTNTKSSGRRLTSDGNYGNTKLSRSTSTSGLPPWLEELIRWILPSTYFSSTNDTDENETKTSEEDGDIIVHRGSCHCQSIIFQWEAPRSLPVQDGPGKIRFRHTQIAASSFRLIAGSDFLQTYYVVAESIETYEDSIQDRLPQPTSESVSCCVGMSSWDHHLHSVMHKKSRNANGDSKKIGAHSFCRRCGVHILYAPSSQSSKLEINVDCSDDVPLIRSRSTEHGCNNQKVKVDNIVDDQSVSAGIALPGQWKQPQLQYPPRPHELKGMLMRHQLFKPQNGEFGGAIAANTEHTAPISLKTAPATDLLCRWESPVEAKQHLTNLQPPDTPSTIATSCDGLSAPTISHQGQSSGGDASSSFAEDMLSSASSSSACDGDEVVQNDLASNLAWNEDEQNDTHTCNPSPLSHHSNLSADVTVSTSSLTSTTSNANPMLRDQLKYYMSRHISKPKKGKGNNQL